jgi:solute carrier family 35, member E3
VGTQVVLGLSCLAALFVNLSTFLLIGRTSPLTYNAVGHFKLTAILAGSYLLFGQVASLGNLLGVSVTLFGLFWYTRVKLQEQAAASKVSLPDPPKSVSEDQDADEELQSKV